MDGFITATIIAGLIVVLLLLIYLIDRVNSIERETRSLKSAASTVKLSSSAGPFAGLSGRKLWDAVTGAAPHGLNQSDWAMVRNNYAIVLQLHIESLFDEGQRDSERGLDAEPKNPRLISNPHGAVESWFPTDQANAIYRCGWGVPKASEEELKVIRATLNQAGRALYQQSGFSPAPNQSDLLLPGPLPAFSPLIEPQAGTAITGGVQPSNSVDPTLEP